MQPIQAQTESRVGKIAGALGSSANPGLGGCVKWAPGGALLAWARGNAVTVSGGKKGEQVGQVLLPAPVLALHWSPDASLLVAAMRAGVAVWRAPFASSAVSAAAALGAAPAQAGKPADAKAATSLCAPASTFTAVFPHDVLPLSCRLLSWVPVRNTLCCVFA